MQVCDVGTLYKLLLTRWWHVNAFFVQVIRYFNSWWKIIGYCYKITSYNHNHKLHTISKNGLQMCKYNRVNTDLVFFYASNRAHWARHTKWMHHKDNRTRLFGPSEDHIPVRVFINKEDLEILIEDNWDLT